MTAIRESSAVPAPERQPSRTGDAGDRPDPIAFRTAFDAERATRVGDRRGDPAAGARTAPESVDGSGDRVNLPAALTVVCSATANHLGVNATRANQHAEDDDARSAGGAIAAATANGSAIATATAATGTSIATVADPIGPATAAATGAAAPIAAAAPGRAALAPRGVGPDSRHWDAEAASPLLQAIYDLLQRAAAEDDHVGSDSTDLFDPSDLVAVGVPTISDGGQALAGMLDEPVGATTGVAPRHPSQTPAPPLAEPPAELPQLTSQVRLMLGDGADRVVVAVRVRGDQVAVEIVASNPETADALARNAPVLVDAMHEHGLDLTDLSTTERDARPRRDRPTPLEHDGPDEEPTAFELPA